MFSPEFMWVSSYVLDMSCNWGIVWSSCTLGEPSGAGVSRQSWDPLGKPDNLDAEKDIELFNNNCSIWFLRFLMVKSKFIFSAQESALFGRGAFVSQRPHWNRCCLILIQCCKTRWILQGQMSPRSPSFAPLSAIVCAAMSRYGCGRFFQRHGAASGSPRKHHKSLGFHQKP